MRQAQPNFSVLSRQTQAILSTLVMLRLLGHDAATYRGLAFVLGVRIDSVQRAALAAEKGGLVQVVRSGRGRGRINAVRLSPGAVQLISSLRRVEC